ncbi:MAG: hypothetical protein AAGB11_07640 [Pseudomonadota bacterium]
MRPLGNAFARTAGKLTLAPALVGAVLGVSLPGALAADLAMPIIVPPPPAVVVEPPSNLCTIFSPSGKVEVFEEPRGEVWGYLPAGMIVEVMDQPYSDVTDLWVRIKPPRADNYYGWVATASFSCH